MISLIFSVGSVSFAWGPFKMARVTDTLAFPETMFTKFDGTVPFKYS